MTTQYQPTYLYNKESKSGYNLDFTVSNERIKSYGGQWTDIQLYIVNSPYMNARMVADNTPIQPLSTNYSTRVNYWPASFKTYTSLNSTCVWGCMFYSDDPLYWEDSQHSPPYKYALLGPGRLYNFQIWRELVPEEYDAIFTYRQQLFDGTKIIFTNFVQEQAIAPPAPPEPVVTNDFFDFSDDNTIPRYSYSDYDPNGVFTDEIECSQIWFDRYNKLIITSSNNMIICVKPEIYEGNKIKLKIISNPPKDQDNDFYLDEFNRTPASLFSFDQTAIPIPIQLNRVSYYTPPQNNNNNNVDETVLIPLFDNTGDKYDFEDVKNNDPFILNINGDYYLTIVYDDEDAKYLQLSESQIIPYNSNNRELNRNTVLVDRQFIQQLNSLSAQKLEKFKLPVGVITYLDANTVDDGNNQSPVGDLNPTNIDPTVNDDGISSTDPVTSTVDLPSEKIPDELTNNNDNDDKTVNNINLEINDEELKKCSHFLDKINDEIKSNNRVAFIAIIIAAIGIFL